MTEEEPRPIDDGGPAFPESGTPGDYCKSGMSLRDWFAGQAMKSLLLMGTNQPTSKKDVDGHNYEEPDQPWYFGTEAGDHENGVGFDAYNIADAMLAARKEKPNADI